MNDARCGAIRELIPDFVGNRLGATEVEPLEAHVAECAACRAELELAQSLYTSRASVPDGLADRVVDAVRRARPALRRPWWGISAAAVAALALGIGITSGPAGPDDLDVPDFGYEVGEGELWLSDDGLLAGAPSLDGLSDEALILLLDELSAASAGGAA